MWQRIAVTITLFLKIEIFYYVLGIRMCLQFKVVIGICSLAVEIFSCTRTPFSVYVSLMYYVIIFLLLRKLGHLVTIKYDSRPSKGLYKNYMTPRKGEGLSANEGIQLFFLWEKVSKWHDMMPRDCSDMSN